MCTAQVLLFTDVMRRNDCGRISDALPPRYICRKLFADDAPRPARSNLLATLQAQMQKEASDRWNFNFRTETPLPGRYQWVPVRPGTNSATEVPQRSEPSSVVSETESSRTEPDTDSTVIRPSRKTASAKSKVVTQSKITDFLLQRKRHRTAELDLTSPKLKLRRLNAHLDAQATSN